MEVSPKTSVNTSRVVAGVNVDDDVRKMLKKIVSKESEQKKWKNEKLQLVLKKSKKKKRKKSKSDAPVIKNEVDADSLSPSNKQSKIVVKREPGLDASPPPPPNLRSIDVSQPSYFKPNVELELQPILGHSKCRICKSYYPDTDERRNQHLAQHPDRVFLVNLPVDTYYFDIEEAISHLAKFGINRTEVQQKVKDCNLIKLPSNLKGFSCDICKLLDTNSEKEFMIHVKEECKIPLKEERIKHLICFCRGCHSRFPDKVSLSRHTIVGGCWPSMMVINRLYDMSGANAQQVNQQEKAAQDKERMVRIKQEKVERVHQIQIKREMFEARDDSFQMPMIPGVTSVPMNSNIYDAYNIASPQPPNLMPSTKDLRNILNHAGLQPSLPSHVSGIEKIGVAMSNTSSQRRLNDLEPPKVRIKSEKSLSPPMGFDEPSPAFSPVRDPQRSRSSFSSAFVPSPPNPLPNLGDLFTPGSVSRRDRSPSADSIVSCESLQPSVKLMSTTNCLRSACLWTDSHASTCSKLPIMERCSKKACTWFDLHRDYPLCDKLSFYCNCKKEGDGIYKYYDNLPQVKKIPRDLDAERDFSVKEKRDVAMRLLYKKVSTVLKDPRLSKTPYPSGQKIPARSFRGKKGSKRGWGEDNVICTWSGLSMVLVSNAPNPHVVSDHESDVELCDEEDVVRAKKRTKRKESSQERQIW